MRRGTPRRYKGHPRRACGDVVNGRHAYLSPYHLPTFALPTPYLGRFMFGFRLKAKPEHEAAQVGSW